MIRRVLVTGGLGYLGGRISTYLSNKDNFELRLTNRRVDSEVPVWARGLEILSADFGDGDVDMGSLCQGMDAVVHLVAINALQSGDDHELAKIVNVEGTRKLRDAAHEMGVKRFVYVSTVHVYGPSVSGHIDEETPAQPTHPYSETHLAAEKIILEEGGPEGIVLRLSNALGAPADIGANCWMLAANDLCRQAMEDGELVLRGSGQDVRDFITLSDVVRAIEFFLTQPAKSSTGKIFNIASAKPMSLLELAKLVAARTERIFGHRPEIRTQESKRDSPLENPIYSTDKLSQVGFILECDINSEIDATLRLCQQAFGEGKGQ